MENNQGAMQQRPAPNRDDVITSRFCRRHWCSMVLYNGVRRFIDRRIKENEKNYLVKYEFKC